MTIQSFFGADDTAGAATFPITLFPASDEDGVGIGPRPPADARRVQQLAQAIREYPSRDRFPVLSAVGPVAYTMRVIMRALFREATSYFQFFLSLPTPATRLVHYVFHDF